LRIEGKISKWTIGLRYELDNKFSLRNVNITVSALKYVILVAKQDPD